MGRVLAAGSVRILRQSRLSRGQAVALTLSLLAAVAVGVMVQPRDGGNAPPPAADGPATAPDAADASPSDTGAVVHALDGLAGQIAALNDRLGDAVARERAASDRSAPPAGAERDGGLEQTAQGPAQAAEPPARPRRASPARPRPPSLRRNAAPRRITYEPVRFRVARIDRPMRGERRARRPRHERRRGLSALRDFFLRGLRLPF